MPNVNIAHMNPTLDDRHLEANNPLVSLDPAGLEAVLDHLAGDRNAPAEVRDLVAATAQDPSAALNKALRSRDVLRGLVKYCDGKEFSEPAVAFLQAAAKMLAGRYIHVDNKVERLTKGDDDATAPLDPQPNGNVSFGSMLDVPNDVKKASGWSNGGPFTIKKSQDTPGGHPFQNPWPKVSTDWRKRR